MDDLLLDPAWRLLNLYWCSSCGTAHNTLDPERAEAWRRLHEAVELARTAESTKEETDA